jgi:hypothetical protein
VTLRRVRLELARSAETPEGSAARGYEFVAPLDARGRLDASEWTQSRAFCIVRRFWNGEEQRGHLVHREGDVWAFHYDFGGESVPDEPGYRLGRHVFRPGEYVSFTEQDGVMRTFRVAAVTPA